VHPRVVEDQVAAVEREAAADAVPVRRDDEDGER
jgi:hypothetical protein